MREEVAPSVARPPAPEPGANGQGQPGAGPAAGFAALLVVFASTRLLALILLRPGGFFGDWSDYVYFKEMAALSSQGYYPYVHYWVEYPPVVPWLLVGAYRLSLLLPVFKHPLLWFQLIFSGLLLLCDAGSLWLVRRIGARLWGERRGLDCAWLYAGLFLPLYALAVWFDTLAVFCLLLGLELLLQRRPLLAGLATGLGIGVKLFPGLLVPVGLRALRGTSAWARYLLAAGGLTAAIFVPFYAINPTMLRASIAGIANRRAWETVWALLDGYYGTGGVPALADRLFYPESAYWENPSRLPWTAITLAFAVAYATAWWLAAPARRDSAAPDEARASFRLGGFLDRLLGRARPAPDARSVVALAALTVTLFLLYNKGFSQQFTLLVLPFVVLLAPTLRGALFAVALTLNNTLVEGYLFVNLFPDDRWLLRATVGLRTLLLALFAVEAASLLFPRLGRPWRAAKPALTWSLAVLAVGLGLLGAGRLGEAYWQKTAAESPRSAAIQAIQRTPPETMLLLTQQTVYEAVYPYTRPRPAYLVADAKLLERAGATSLHARLAELTRDRREVLLVVDEGEAGSPLADATRRWLQRNYGDEEAWAESGTRVERYDAQPPPAFAEPATFGESIALEGAALRPSTVRPGGELRVVLYWRALRAVGRDYTVFVHLLDAEERIVAQRDSPPLDGRYPTGGWLAGESVADEVALAIPADLSAGDYKLAVGLYSHPTLERLPVRRGPASGDRVLLGPARVEPAQ